ncbi:ATP-binding protein [Kitasatospora sp. NPDC052896]|uniref:ATP-binding protein n=1 Tax=Kitasatospora sp. NPDC052896 TaxID=3364061 RepID=UPI0037CA7534
MALMVAREVPTSSTMAVPHGPASVGAARRRLRRDLGDREVPDTVIDDAVLILSELLSNSCRYARPLAPLLDLDGGVGEEFLERSDDLRNSAESEPNETDAAAQAAEAAELDALLVGAPVGARHAVRRAARRAADARGAHSAHRAPSAPEDQGGVLVRWQVHPDGRLTLEVTDGGAATRPQPARPSLTAKGGRGLSIVGRLAADWGVRDAPGEVTVWAALSAYTEHARSA